MTYEPDWYDTHCPTCNALEPDHTPTCAVVHVGAERCGNTISPRDNDGQWGCCTLSEGHEPPCVDSYAEMAADEVEIRQANRQRLTNRGRDD